MSKLFVIILIKACFLTTSSVRPRRTIISHTMQYIYIYIYIYIYLYIYIYIFIYIYIYLYIYIYIYIYIYNGAGGTRLFLNVGIPVC